MSGHKLNNSDALKFMFAGNSTFTVVNTRTENRFTFKVRKSKDKESNLFFVNVLTGPDTYTYLGTVVEGVYRHGKKSAVSSEAQSVKVFDYVLNKLKLDKLQDFVEVWHEGTCGKCGRVLTVPSSIENGLGPECIKSLSKQEKRDKFLSLILS
jgi:hypothetical protein